MSGATSLATISTGLQIGGAVSGAFGSYQQAQAQQQSYDYQAAVSRNNAKIAEWQAQDALARGAKSEQAQKLRTAQLRSTQRAAFAARGVALNEGSPLNILNDTDYLGRLDAQTIHNNAAKEAWGYRNQAANYSSDASMLRSAGSNISPGYAAATSLLSGAGQVASSWYRYNRTVT